MKKTTQNECPVEKSNPLLVYCADCGEQLGESTIEHQDERVICPKNPSHLARVVKAPAGQTWLRVERWLMCWESRYSPRRWCCWKGFFEERAGTYLLARLAVVVLLCVALGQSYGTAWHWWMLALSYIVGLLFLADLLFSSTSIAFVSAYPANPIRSATFTLLGLITLSMIFALFFLRYHLQHQIDFQAIPKLLSGLSGGTHLSSPQKKWIRVQSMRLLYPDIDRSS